MFDNFIQNYGYLAVFLCACVEGEVAVLTAGFFCKQGYLSLSWVIFFAFLGTCLTEQSLFFVGRIYGNKIIKKFPRFFKHADKAIDFLYKYNTAFIFGSRFVYGIRNISPIIIGISHISPLKFSLLNIPAAIIWAILVAGAGYLFSDALAAAEAHMQIIQVIALALCIMLLIYYIHKRNKNNSR